MSNRFDPHHRVLTPDLLNHTKHSRDAFNESHSLEFNRNSHGPNVFPKLEVNDASADKITTNIKPKAFNPNPQMVAKLITEFKFPMKNGIAAANKVPEAKKQVTANQTKLLSSLLNMNMMSQGRVPHSNQTQALWNHILMQQCASTANTSSFTNLTASSVLKDMQLGTGGQNLVQMSNLLLSAQNNQYNSDKERLHHISNKGLSNNLFGIKVPTPTVAGSAYPASERKPRRADYSPVLSNISIDGS
jgi:hypothetical protein